MGWRGGKGREKGWEGDLGEGINEFSFFLRHWIDNMAISLSPTGKAFPPDALVVVG